MPVVNQHLELDDYKRKMTLGVTWRKIILTGIKFLETLNSFEIDSDEAFRRLKQS